MRSLDKILEKVGWMHESISKAVKVFRGNPNMEDEEVFHSLVKQGMERQLAARIVEFLPIAYSRLVLGKSGARFSDVFQRNIPGEEVIEKPLSEEPVWHAALDFGRAEISRGISGHELLLLAAHSAEFRAANQLLNAGSKLEKLVFTPPVLTWPEYGPEQSPVH
jgi:hypothetical protein